MLNIFSYRIMLLFILLIKLKIDFKLEGLIKYLIGYFIYLISIQLSTFDNY